MNTFPLELTRDLQLEIAGWVVHSDQYPVDQAMDDLAQQIEDAMDRDRYLAGSLSESVLEGTEMTVYDDADPIIGVVTLTYAMMYRSVAMVDTLDDFITAGTTTKVDGSSVDNASQDVISVRI